MRHASSAFLILFAVGFSSLLVGSGAIRVNFAIGLLLIVVGISSFFLSYLIDRYDKSKLRKYISNRNNWRNEVITVLEKYRRSRDIESSIGTLKVKEPFEKLVLDKIYAVNIDPEGYIREAREVKRDDIK